MSDLLLEPLSVLCDEVGVSLPAPDGRGAYHLSIDGHDLRCFSLPTGRVILLGIIGGSHRLAEARSTSRHQLLLACLSLQAVRLAKLATPQVLTIEPETDELVLWQAMDAYSVSIPGLLAAVEALLNELEFWKNWLSSP